MKKLTKITMRKMPSEVEALLLSNFSDGSNVSVVAGFEMKFKGELYYLATLKTVNDDKEECLKKFKAFQKVYDFTSSLSKEERSLITGTLTNRIGGEYVRSAQKTALQKALRIKENRVLFTVKDQMHWTDKGLESNGKKKASFLASELDEMSEVKRHIINHWSSTPSGEKAERRSRSKTPRSRRKFIFGNIESLMVGGVHTESGIYLRAYQEKMNQILRTSKKPMTSERHFGIELEFMLPRENSTALENAFRESPFKNYLALGTDGSVTSNDEVKGSELRICVPHGQANECVEFVSKTLNKFGCKVDKSCGLHVHLDARNDSAKDMFDRLLLQQKALFGLVPASRRNNQYCGYTSSKDWRGNCRYKAINSLAYSRYKTIEVRLHSGTIDSEKILNWAWLLSAIAYNTEKVSRSRTVETMLEKHESRISYSMKTFFLARAEKFANAGAVAGSGEDAA
jgi:hypothetical protein